MKRLSFFFLMIILIASCHQEEIPSVSDKPEGNQLILIYQMKMHFRVVFM